MNCLKQKETNDCFRTAIACILNKEKVIDIPNFAENKELYTENFYKWLDAKKIQYIELVWSGASSQEHALERVSTSYCIVVTKLNGVSHAVVGLISRHGIDIVWCPAKGEDCDLQRYLEDATSIGFIGDREACAII